MDVLVVARHVDLSESRAVLDEMYAQDDAAAAQRSAAERAARKQATTTPTQVSLTNFLRRLSG